MITSRPFGSSVQYDCRLCGWSDIFPAGTSVEHVCDFSAINGCRHLLGPLINSDNNQVTERVPCLTCGSFDGMRDASVFRCNLFNKCLPLFGRNRHERDEYQQQPNALKLCECCPHKPM